MSRRVFLASVALFLAACASTRTTREADGPTSLRVENRTTLDMTIYALRGSERIRLGTVTALQTAVLPIPSQVIFGTTRLRFLADPIGSNRTPVSDEISVTPGDEVTWVLPPQ